MQKEIIVVSSYCPDDERKHLLNKCIDSLQGLRQDFDILITTHSHIPEYIAKKVDFVFYDANNELIHDWDLQNTPWFSPFDGLTIVSSLIANYSTYIACYRSFCGGLSIAKNFGYTKVHYLDYDAVINDYSEFYENSKILDDHVAVQYKKEYKNFEQNVEGAVGIFQAINLNKVNSLLTSFNKEKHLEILKNSPNKTPELTQQYMLHLDGEKVFYKNLNVLIEKGNILNLSSQTQKDDLDDWTVPFYDTKTNKINVIAWNSKKDKPIDVSFIVNKEKFVTMNQVNKFEWRIQDIDDINNVNEILIIVDNKVKDHIIINTKELKEKFIRNNQTQY